MTMATKVTHKIITIHLHIQKKDMENLSHYSRCPIECQPHLMLMKACEQEFPIM